MPPARIAARRRALALVRASPGKSQASLTATTLQQEAGSRKKHHNGVEIE